MKKLSIFIILVSFVVISCSKDNSTSPSNADGKFIWPIQVGNFWKFKVTSYDSTGKVTSTIIDSTVVAKDSTINSEQVFLMMTFRNSKLNFKGFVQNRNDGFYLIDVSGGFPAFYRWYKFKGVAGDTYMNGNQEMKINSISSTVNLISRNFLCYEYFQENDYIDQYTKQNIYLSPDIGLIKNVVYVQNKGGKLYLSSTLEITGYKVQ